MRLQAVHSKQFHQRKQEETETVDQYAQELRKLFCRAYPRTNQATEEAEGFGRLVLAYQFVAGLKRNLQSKVAGVEGDLEQLLLKTRFEEAKIRDLLKVTSIRVVVKVDQGGPFQQDSEEEPHQDSLTQGKVLTAALLVMGLDTMQEKLSI